MKRDFLLTRTRLGRTFYGLLGRISILNRLRLIFFMLAAFLVSWFAVMVYSSLRGEVSYIVLTNSHLVNETVEYLRNTLRSLSGITKFPVIRVNQRPTETYEYLAEPSKYHRSMLDWDVMNQCQVLFEQYPLILQIYVFDQEGEGLCFRSGQGYLYNSRMVNFGIPTLPQKDSVWFRETMSARGKEYLWPGHALPPLEKIEETPSPYLLFLSRSIFNTEQFKNVGAILAAADLGPPLESFYQRRNLGTEQLGLFNESGRILAGSLEKRASETLRRRIPAGKEAGTVIIGGKLYTYSIALPPYLCAIETPLDSALTDSLRRQAFPYVALLLFLAVVLLFTYFIVYGLIREEYQRELSYTQTELQMLRQQINPHFLYNTLEGIRSAADSGSGRDIGEMASLLARTLRYGISAPDEIVTIGRELECLEDYIRLQRFHHRDRVCFHVHVDRALYDTVIPKLLLQPLVENALYHGISFLAENGAITVLGVREGDSIVFRVIDNGVGIQEERLNKLRGYIRGENDDFNSIGLRNVNRRIQLYYGEEYGISLESGIDSGTMVIVRLPQELPPGMTERKHNVQYPYR
ncbi:MAG: sensor histidine kinase [Treponema sp.]|jgi:signal transduction histidine kinase|nr:sensor histidine kinase [Treponema sp.]